MWTYYKSKTLAEKAAWEFQQSLPEEERFELVTICPSYVVGPSLIPGGFGSAGLVSCYFAGGCLSAFGISIFPCVDVRDVSKLHLESVTRAEAANQRFICSAGSLNSQEVADILHEAFSPHGFTLTTKEKDIPRESKANFCNDKARAVFGEFRPIKEAVIAMA